MTYSVKIVSASREDARLQIEDYFHGNLHHFPKQIAAFDAILALFDSLPPLSVMGYEVEVNGGFDGISIQMRLIKSTHRALRPTRLRDDYLAKLRGGKDREGAG